MMLSKCCSQYASKFGKLSSGHRPGKGKFSFQSQRKAMPKNAQTTAQLHSFHMLLKKKTKGTCISIITLNVSGLNVPTKRHRLAEWIQKQDPYISCLQETHFRPKDTYKLKVRGWKNIFHANGNQKKPGVAILISDKIDLKIKNITRDHE